VPVPNLSEWRASVTGDMTWAFNFAASPDPSMPELGNPVQRALPDLPSSDLLPAASKSCGRRWCRGLYERAGSAIIAMSQASCDVVGI
jgi:phospholipase C